MVLTYQYNNATLTNYDNDWAVCYFVNNPKNNAENKPKNIKPYKFIKDKDNKKMNGKFK